MEHGKIIFLNGTSSSGKTTLAKLLLPLLEEPYVYMALDDLAASGLNEWYSRKPERIERFPIDGIIRGFHHAIAGYSRAGVGVIIDHCINWRTGMQECIGLFRDTRVVFVEVVCSVQALREREKARGDRKVGQAESQIPGFESLRREFPYDLQVDTSLHLPAECAQMVVNVVNDNTLKTSFEKMREAKPPSETVPVPNGAPAAGGSDDKRAE